MATQDFYTGIVVTVMAAIGIALAIAKSFQYRGRVKRRLKRYVSHVVAFRSNQTRRKAA